MVGPVAFTDAALIGDHGSEGGKHEQMKRRLNRAWPSGAPAFGGTGLTAAIGLLMVLAPASGAVAPRALYGAPYKGTVAMPNGYETAPSAHANKTRQDCASQLGPLAAALRP